MRAQDVQTANSLLAQLAKRKETRGMITESHKLRLQYVSQQDGKESWMDLSYDEVRAILDSKIKSLEGQLAALGVET